MKIAVGILTQHQVTDRRLAVEATWVKDLRNAGIDCFYLTGGNVEATELKDGVLTFPCADDIDNLAHKTQNFCRYALSSGYDRIFKCDDDTFVHPKRWLSYQPDGDYVGIEPVDDYVPTFASGGAGYWLSKKAFEFVAKADIEQVWKSWGIKSAYYEDLIISKIMKTNGIKFTQDCHFQAWGRLKRTHPASHNSIITTHYICPKEMFELYEASKTFK